MSEQKKPTIMRFKLTLDNPLDAFKIFWPKGRQLLNRTEWRGKEPRSCAVTNMHSGPHPVTEKKTVFDLEVSYRPKGYITFVGNTKYDGWTAMMLDKQKDGTPLDGHGKPLQPGQDPVWLPFEVFEDVEFDDMNFGEFVEEVEVTGIKHITFEEVMQQIHRSSRMNAGMSAEFMAPRRQRPLAKIVLSDLPIGPAGGRSDMRTFFVDKTAPHFKQTLFDRLYEVASGFLEGRYSLKAFVADDIAFVELSDSVMQLKIKPGEAEAESIFDVFDSYVSSSDMEEMAKRLMAAYEVDVTIVDGKEGGFVLKRTSREGDEPFQRIRAGGREDMAKHPVDVAELLEAIAKNADPYVVARAGFERFLGNMKAHVTPTPHMISPDHERKWLVVTYMIPVDQAMEGVGGTPEEVVEWAQTGLQAGQQIELQPRSLLGKPAFAIIQTFKDEHTYADYMEMSEKFAQRLRSSRP